jgi:hypothetical protein
MIKFFLMDEEVVSPARPLPAAAIAFALGLAGDLLLRALPWGVNVAIWTVLVLGGVIWLMRRERPQPIASIAFAATGALLAAACISWRDSSVLVTLDILLLALFLLFLSLNTREVVLWSTGIARLIAALFFTIVFAIPGMFQLLLADVRWRELRPGLIGRRALIVLRGLAIALPMLLLFSVLLSSADAAFSGLLSNVFNIDLPRLIGHVVLTVLLTFLTAGFLRATLRGPAVPDSDRPSFFHLGAAEVNIAIGLVDVLFTAFVAVQFRYFFGGADLVRLAPKLTYAEYARHGFFELVTVAALVVPLLLFADWISDRREAGGAKTFRILALIQVMLVGVMLVSAHRRMQLYVDEYGLTELRLYTTAFMFWLGALLVWFAVTVLTGNRARFLIGALASGVVVVLALHAIDPDNRIVRTNVERAAAGKRALDMTYATSLSADATPALIAALPLLPEPQRLCAAHHLLWLDVKDDRDVRSWNASRNRAHAAIDAHRGELVAMGSRCPGAAPYPKRD